MSILAPQLNSHLEPFPSRTYSKKQLKREDSQTAKHPSFLQAIIEGFVDGVLILTEKGEWIHANARARQICRQFSQYTAQVNSVPQPIWQVCESLLESRQLFPDRTIVFEAEIDTENLATLRIRVRWLELGETDNTYLIVTIEDRHQATQNAAISEANQYGLTPREAEVWLLRRANHSYKEIADKLYITLNTVKKHMKNVYAKQQAKLWSEEEQEVSSFN